MHSGIVFDQTKKSLLSFTVAAVLGVAALSVSTETSAAIIQGSHVTDVVTQTGADTWHYEFTVFNDATGTGDYGEIPAIVDWELPYFSDMGISNITSPEGWTTSIETIGVANATTGWDGVAAWNDPTDPWYVALDGENNPLFAATEVLHWYCVDPDPVLDLGEVIFGGCFNGEAWPDSIIQPGESLSGFSFDASFGPTQSPYQTSWIEQPVNTGDPAFPGGTGVGSPSALGSTTVNVPEPSSIALLGLGLIGILASSANRRRKT